MGDQGEQPQPQAQEEGGAGPSTEATAAVSSVAFVKRNRNRGNIRKRANEDEQEGGEEDDQTKVERKAKSQRGEPLAFTSNQQPTEAAFVTYESNRALPTGKDESVFKMLETETETDRDARALREAVLQQGKEGQPAVDDGKYKGMNNYIDYKAGFRREHTVASQKNTGHGPLRANMYVRMTALMDYNPCICKDYKETGFCSYGDACKFMHDRGDYKQSWELDRDWEEEQKRKLAEKMKAFQADSDEEGGDKAAEEEDDELPFACYVCRNPWGPEAKDPVVTKCKHYFCEACALKTMSKGAGKCAVCNQPTQGIFNVAHEINKKLKKMGKATR